MLVKLFVLIGYVLSSALIGVRQEDVSFPPSPYPHVFYETDSYLAVVLENNEIAYVDRAGAVILYPFVFDNGPDAFSEGLSRYTENGKVGFINEKLEIVIPAQFDWASPFKNGTADVCKGCQQVYPDETKEHSRMEGGDWGTVDKNGTVKWG